MTPPRHLLRTLGGSALCAALVGMGVVAGVVSAAPARATVADVDSGAQITRSDVVERAESWAAAQVPYNQSVYYPTSAARTGTGHSYREDCSGFLSMAWDLPTSAVTGDFVSSSSPYDTRLASWDDLLPGDLLGVSGHVILFLGWSADDAGRHRYFDMASESTSARPAAIADDQDDQGYWKPYVPYRDKQIVTDQPSMVSWGAGRVDEVTLDGNEHLIHSWQTTPGSPWTSEDLTASRGMPEMRGAPVIASRGNGQLDIVGFGTDGALLDVAYAGAWRAATLAPGSATGTPVVGVSAAGSGGRLDLVGRQLGTGGADTAGTLVGGAVTGTSWSGWSVLPGAPAVVDDPALVRSTPTELDAVVEVASGALQLGVDDATGWHWSAALGTTRVNLRPQLAALADGTLVVTSDDHGLPQQDVRATASHVWSGWTATTGPLAVTGSPGPNDTQPVTRLQFYDGYQRPATAGS